MPNWFKYIMGKIRVNSGSGKKVLVNNPGRPSTALVNRPTGSPIPIKTGKDIAVSSYPVYLRNVGNTAEIGTAADKAGVVTILNADPGWSALGTWSQDSNGIFCTGTPTKIIGYNKVGTIFSTNDTSDFTWSDADISFVNESGKMRLTTTDEGNFHKITLDAYGKTMLGGIEFKFDIDVLSTSPPFDFGVMIDAPRVLSCSYSSSMSIQDDGTNILGVSNAATGTGSGTYNITLRVYGNVTTFIVQKGANTSTATLTAPMTTEHNVGKFAIRFTQIDCRIYNVKVDCIAYKNCDNVGIGDSVTRGRGADSFATNHYNQVIGQQPTTWMALGNVGILEWIECIGEIQAVDPAQVWIMGSYVDTPAGLGTFQTRYQDLITAIKLSPSLQKIYHLASFPNNFGTDIRPFNNWKAATFNSGIDRYIDDFYALLLEGSSGYDLKDSYDYGGSHLTQAAQTIVANSIIAEL